MGPWSQTEAEGRLFGDTSPWISQLPRLWRMVAWPDGPIRRPRVPWPGSSDVTVFDENSVARRIEYWCPLMHLVWWYLGWSDPAQGAMRWVDEGMPRGSAGTRVLAKWWGMNSMALAVWQAETTCDLTQHGVPPVGGENRATLARELRTLHSPDALDRWRSIFAGGSDGLHLRAHASSPGWRSGDPDGLIGDASMNGFKGDAAPTMVVDTQEAVVLLDRYPGWHSALSDIVSGDEVDVVIRQIGWLGRFRRSPSTGIWHAAEEEEHLLGWPTIAWDD